MFWRPVLNTTNLSDFSFEKPGPLFAWLPNGKLVVTAGLTLLSVETGEAHRLTSPPQNLAPDFSPAISPDGRRVAFGRSSGYAMSDLYLIDLGPDFRPKGDLRRLTSLKRQSHSPVWTPDGRKIIFTSGKELWRVAASDSAVPERLSISDAWTSAIARTGNRLVYERRMFGDHIWRLTLSDLGETIGPPVQFLSSTRAGVMPTILSGRQTDRLSIDSWGHPRHLGLRCGWLQHCGSVSQPGVFSGTPRWAPDGERLAFDSNAAGNMDIYVIRFNGGKPIQLTTDPADDQIPSWSADGSWVYFASKRSGRFEVWKPPASAGEAVQVTRNGGWVAFESRDGKFLYYTKTDEAHGGLWKMPVGGGEEELIIPSIAFRNFAVANDGIYFIEAASGKPLHSVSGLRHRQGKDHCTHSVGR